MNNEPLTLDQWESTYLPVQDDEGCEVFFETYHPHLDELAVCSGEQALANLPNKHKPYNHVWTRVDGDNGKLILLNGYHLCNRLDYCVTKLPWGTGNLESDNKLYIEVTYED